MLSPKGSRQKDQKRVLPAFEQSYGWFYSLAIVVYVCRSGGCAESQDSSLAADAGPVGGGRASLSRLAVAEVTQCSRSPVKPGSGAKQHFTNNDRGNVPDY